MTATVLAWKPRHDQLVVRPLEASSRTAGGILVAEAHQEAPQQGVVVANGPDAALDLQPGIIVAYGKFAGIPFEDPATGHRLLVMRDTECILARGEVALTECTQPSGRTVIHEVGQTCEWCPTPELDALRAKHQADNAAALNGGTRLDG